MTQNILLQTRGLKKKKEQSSPFSRYNYYDQRPNLELFIEINLSSVVSLPLPFLFAVLASSFGSSHFECGVWAFSGSFRRLPLGLQQQVAVNAKRPDGVSLFGPGPRYDLATLYRCHGNRGHEVNTTFL